MNVQETAAVLAYFGSAWPSMDITDDTADVWVLELADIDPLDGAGAMRRVVQTSDFPPSIAKYRTACQEIRLRRQQNRPISQAIGPGQAEWPAQLVADLKAFVDEKGPRRHWHGGPKPCPVCGGIAPGKASA